MEAWRRNLIECGEPWCPLLDGRHLFRPRLVVKREHRPASSQRKGAS